jgi:hypothetical protein
MESISMCSHRSFPFAGRETSGASSAGASRGSALQTPLHATGDQEMLETCRAGALVTPSSGMEALLDSVLSARADDASRSQERWSRRTHGSLSRPRRRSARNVGEREPERRGRPVVLSGDESRPGPMATRFAMEWTTRLRGPPEQRGTGLSKGRAHDRIEVAEVGRTASSSWTRAAPGNRGGVPKRNATRETSGRE